MALRLVHAIHDFLPRHRAGSEIYAATLCMELVRRGHHVTVMCAEYDPGRPHGHVAWRTHEGLPVAEVVNNWACGSFDDAYAPPVVGTRLAQLLDALEPDVLHIHSLLNLSLDLPRLARARGIPVAATLHDHSLVCPSGGQRLHQAEAHVCHDIDTARCARCFRQSPFHQQAAFARVAGAPRIAAPARSLIQTLTVRLPALSRRVRAASMPALSLAVDQTAIERRLAAARRAWDDLDAIVAPSQALADAFRHLGFGDTRLAVADYGFEPASAVPRVRPGTPLRIGFIGTLVWHKGVHVLVEAVRGLAGAELLLFGDPAVFPGYVADLRARAARLPVRFMGAFDDAGRSGAFGEIDVLVVPSIWPENSPLVIHEAFMAGVPVVGSAIGGIPELVRDGVSGLLVTPGSVAALHTALASLVADPALVARIARQLPKVRTIAEDATEWEARYRALVSGCGNDGALPSRCEPGRTSD
jgi:glycosyltransferase involved in cell wall biosynthesis